MNKKLTTNNNYTLTSTTTISSTQYITIPHKMALQAQLPKPVSMPNPGTPLCCRNGER